MTVPNSPQKKTFDATQANAIFSDVARHLRSVHDRLLRLKSNSRDLVSLFYVEQRFNAFRGTFSFFKTYAGFEEVMALAQYIEDIGYTYRKTGKPEITSPHFDVLYRSVITCLKIFQSMREGKPILQDTRNDFIKIKDARSVMFEIETKAHVAQGEADKILNEAIGQ